MVPQPKRIRVDTAFYAYRYAERTIQQAIVQKLARVISGLRATRLLAEGGFSQEQMAFQRILDELIEDVTFLAFAVINNDVTKLHQRYLKAFYEECNINSHKNRVMIPRKKIRAYLQSEGGVDEQQANIRDAGRMLSKMFSDFLHAASPQIMEMYFGQPPKYHIHGVCNTPRHREYKEMFWNYIFRSLHSFALASKAFGEDDLCKGLGGYASKFASRAGI